MEKMSCDSAANPLSNPVICLLNHTPLGAFITLSGALMVAAGDNSGLVSGPTDVRLIEGQFNAPLLPNRGIAEVPGPPGILWHTTTYVDTGEDLLGGGKSKQGYVFFARGTYKAVAVWAADQSINRGEPVSLAWR